MGKMWSRLVGQYERTRGNCDSTYRSLSLGSRDAETGHRTKAYAESTEKLILVARGDTKTALPPGTYVRSDWLGVVSPDVPVNEYDQFETAGGVFYEVTAVRPRYVTPDEVEFFEVDLHKLLGVPLDLPAGGYPYTYPHAYS